MLHSEELPRVSAKVLTHVQDNTVCNILNHTVHWSFYKNVLYNYILSSLLSTVMILIFNKIIALWQKCSEIYKMGHQVPCTDLA